MKEEKVLFQSPANAEAVQIKRERMERFGWILENSEYDQDRNLTRLFYTRDLSIPENQQKKELEEEAEDAFLAQKFAENNISYCEYIIIMRIAMLFCAGLVYLFRFTDILTYNKFETEAELENFKQTFVYEFPEGKTLFGKTGFSYTELMNFLTLALGGIAAICLAVILIMARSTRKNKLIQRSEYQYLIGRQAYFEELACEMENFSRELNETMDLAREE